jgi:aminotransferase in exopolysaccharide biosynthesis
MNDQAIIDFIKNLYPDKQTIALHEPVFSGNEKKYVAECIDSTYVSSVGPFVGKFEQAIAEFAGNGPENEIYAVACVNGTAALHLALLAAGVTAGDEVITQPLTFIATVNPILYAGARPVFVDIDADSLGLSPARLRAFLETHTKMRGGQCINSRTGAVIRACVPMHTFGNPGRIDEIAGICHEFGITLIEDAAESIGSYYKGQHTGTFGRMGVLSFNGNKTITTGGGGMIITRDAELASHLKHLSTQAKIPHPWEFSHDEIGYNYRLPNINAALGVAQMEYVDRMLASKREIAAKYAGFFAGIGIPMICEIPDARSNFWLNGIFLANRTERDEFLQAATSRGVQCRPAWNLIPSLAMYKDFQCEEIPVAIHASETLVNIPSSPVLNKAV